MPNKKRPTSPARDRVVFEVTVGATKHRLEANTAGELSVLLAPLLPGLEPYSVRAAARLASIDRAWVETVGWSIRRLGTMAFLPDEVTPAQRATPRTPGGAKGPPRTAPEPHTVADAAAATGGKDSAD